MIKAWELTEDEFNLFKYSIPVVTVSDIRGKYLSLNGVNTIEVRSSRRTKAGLTYTYSFYLNGKKMRGTVNHMRKLLLELPEDYPYFIVYDLVKEWAKENNL